MLENKPENALWNISDIRNRMGDSLETMGIIPLNILCLNSVRRFEEASNLWVY